MKYIKKRFLTVVLLAAAMAVQDVAAQNDRHIFTSAFDAIADKAAVFKPGGEWFPYPSYSDRDGWDALTGEYRQQLISQGEKYLDFKFIPVPASVYLEYEKTKDRGLMRSYDYPNREALANLTLAELAEGEGRFMSQIIDGVWYASERTSWNHAQHTTHQLSRRTLPSQEERVMTLLAASYSMNVAIAWHFFHEEWDKIDPSISKTVLDALEKNTFKPYMERNWHWMGLGGKDGEVAGGSSGAKVNNWNCHCNFFCTLAFLLADQNPGRLVAAVERSVNSFDKYMDYAKLDGACEEGPEYWTMAGGKVYDYARMMCDASYGAIDLLRDGQVRRMGEFMVSSHIGDGWQLNFGDGDARQSSSEKNGDLFLRYGHDSGSGQLENLGLGLLALPAEKKWDLCSVSPSEEGKEEYRCLEVLRARSWLEGDKRSALEKAGGDWEKMQSRLCSFSNSVWYPDTQVAILRNSKGWYVGAKAGNNGESHGHHDVGSALVFVDNCPVLVDPGVCTYVKATFGPERYTLWCMQTLWHNLPLVNGQVQGQGGAFKASDVSCDLKKGVFRCDIAGAYPSEAGVSSWVRTYTLGKDALTLCDSYRLEKRTDGNDIHFITPGLVYLPGEKYGEYLVKSGEAIIVTHSHSGNRTLAMRLTFPRSLGVTVETKPMDDPRFRNAWNDALRKIIFTIPSDAPLCGEVSFTLKRLPSVPTPIRPTTR